MSKLPKRYTAFIENYPAIGEAYHALGTAVGDAGPLDDKSRALIKLGMCIGAGMEGGAHSQARKALDAGATPEELRHAALQALTTLGFPTMMKGLSWIEDVLTKHQEQL
jgi:alkylhydroperoxidase/carboxymuconolactone decarboxylase family protein YurZ